MCFILLFKKLKSEMQTKTPTCIEDLPIFLSPGFRTRFSPSIVLVRWFAIDQFDNSVGLQIDFPRTNETKTKTFHSFRACVDYLRHPNDKEKNTTNIEECFMAFSWSNVLPFVKQCCANPRQIPQLIKRYQFPLKPFLQKIATQQPKQKYSFQDPCQKHVAVLELHKVIDKTTSMKVTEKKTEKEISLGLNWNAQESIDTYFMNIDQRMASACQDDPVLRAILDWKPEPCGGWDMRFFCQFDSKNDEKDVDATGWIHYSALQINPTYQKILHAYIATKPAIVKHVEVTKQNHGPVKTVL